MQRPYAWLVLSSAKVGFSDQGLARGAIEGALGLPSFIAL
jgi:hypothetical protein